MDEKELRKYLEYLVRQNNVLIEQVNTLNRVIANHIGLAIEDCEDGDIYET